MKKEYIPNIFSIARIVFTIIVIILCLLKFYKVALVFTVIGCLTDFLDGYFARKLNTISRLGIKLDIISDKVFAIGLLGVLFLKRKILLIPLILEVLITITNLIWKHKTKIIHTLPVDKIKTVILYLTFIVTLLTFEIKGIKFVMNGFAYATINLQILSFISYALFYIEKIKNPPIRLEEQPKRRKAYDREIEKTKTLSDLTELLEKYEVNGKD